MATCTPGGAVVVYELGPCTGGVAEGALAGIVVKVQGVAGFAVVRVGVLVDDLGPLVGGVAGAVYEGLRGGAEPEQEP